MGFCMVIDVCLDKNSYKIYIQKGSINFLNDYFDLNHKVLIVSDDHIPNEYVLNALSQIKDGYVLRFPQGEKNKTMETYQKILSFLAENNFSRNDVILAIGGGLTSDIAGFAASTYMRGIPFYILPTTLLADVDASIGGKVGVNFLNTKNLIGAFYQPKGVLIDVNTLYSLDDRIFDEGVAEIIKMAATSSKELFEYLENIDDIKNHLEEIIYQAIKIKASVIEKDEKETNLRRVLNFGHTLGHAIEAKSNGGIYHGEAVAIGMNYFSYGLANQRIKKLLEKYHLPTQNPYFIQDLIPYLSLDKKSEGENITVVEVKEIGQFELNKIPLKNLIKRLEEKR